MTLPDISVRRGWWWSLLLAVAMVLLANGYVIVREGGLPQADKIHGWDHTVYIAMAKGPQTYSRADAIAHAEAHQAPWCYRALVPYVAFSLTKCGLSTNAAFFLITNVSLVLFLFVLYPYLLRLGLAPADCLLGIFLAGSLQGAVRWYAYQYWMTDPPMLLFFVLAFYYVEKNDRFSLLMVVLVSVMIRETIILALPYYFLRQLKRSSVRDAIREVITVGVCPLLVYSLIHYYFIPIENPSALDELRFGIDWRIAGGLEQQLYCVTIGSLGVLFPLCLLYPERLLRTCRDNLDKVALVAAIYASLLFANNTDRLLAYAIPIVLPFALHNLRRWSNDTGVRAVLVIVPVVVAQLAFYFLTQYDNCDKQPFNIVVTIAMALLLAALAFYRVRASVERRRGDGAA